MYTDLTDAFVSMSAAEANLAGAKAAAVATIASAIPTVSFHHKFQLFFSPQMKCRLAHA
jgi:hypothetical protein